MRLSAAKASCGLISLPLARHMSVCKLFVREEVEQAVESNLSPRKELEQTVFPQICSVHDSVT